MTEYVAHLISILQIKREVNKGGLSFRPLRLRSVRALSRNPRRRYWMLKQAAGTVRSNTCSA